MSIPKRIFYIDSEGWFITASDQYDRDGKLWKTVATFNAYRDRPVPDASIAIWPFKRMFQTALVDEDVTNGFSTVVLSPGVETDEHESWYINMGLATENFFNPNDDVERRALESNVEPTVGSTPSLGRGRPLHPVAIAKVARIATLCSAPIGSPSIRKRSLATKSGSPPTQEEIYSHQSGSLPAGKGLG